MAMTVLQEGFREIGRKVQRMSLSRQIKAAGRTHAAALRALGKRALEAGVTAPASDDLMSRFNETQAKGGKLQSQLGALEEDRKKLEQQRDADAARFASLEREVLVKKNPLDSEIAGQQEAATESQQQIHIARRRQLHVQQERLSLETALSRPDKENAPSFNRGQAEAGLAALVAEVQQLEATQTRSAEAEAAAAREIERLKAEIAPLQEDLSRISVDRKQASDASKQALADVRRKADQLRAEEATVSRQRDALYEELGGVIAAAGIVESALAAELGAVAAAAQAQAALQGQYAGLLQQSQNMPSGTMAKFTGVMMAALLAVGAAAYAANQANQSVGQTQAPPPAAAKEEDCRMTYSDDKTPVVADPGGPYTIERTGTVTLDGSKSQGKCLTYKWTFEAAPKNELDQPHHSSDPDAEQKLIAVAARACPLGTVGNPDAFKMGPKTPTKFLCSLTVRLTVAYGSNTDSKTVLVKVTPRGGAKGWRTSVETAQDTKFSGDWPLIRKQQADHAQTDLLLGKNVCAFDTNPGHALHAGRSWMGEGYTVTTLSDPNGPFDNWAYVGSSTLKIKRLAQINQKLGAGSALSRENIKKGYSDINTLRDVVTEHEKLHGTLIFEKMTQLQNEKNDPANIIEAVSAAVQAEVVLGADMAVDQAETQLYPPQGDAKYIKNHEVIKSRLMKRFNRAGKILLQDIYGVYGEYPIPSFAQVGENEG